MKRKPRLILMGAAALGLAFGPALPASAGALVYSYAGSNPCWLAITNNTTLDNAVTESSGSYCVVGDIRHYYGTSGYVGWTQWRPSGSTQYSYTLPQAELIKSEHKFSIHGAPFDKVLPR